ncbi:MAG: KH domain-containing protein [Clostridia bacterium]|nr:KH domain-containing protein [Clostridia bacterium]
MEELLVSIAQGLVEDPSQVTVTKEDGENDSVVYHLHVAEGDMGRVIGKQGRIAKAIRTVMRAVATRNNIRVTVEID